MEERSFGNCQLCGLSLEDCTVDITLHRNIEAPFSNDITVQVCGDCYEALRGWAANLIRLKA